MRIILPVYMRCGKKPDNEQGQEKQSGLVGCVSGAADKHTATERERERKQYFGGWLYMCVAGQQTGKKGKK